MYKLSTNSLSFSPPIFQAFFLLVFDFEGSCLLNRCTEVYIPSPIPWLSIFLLLGANELVLVMTSGSMSFLSPCVMQYSSPSLCTAHCQCTATSTHFDWQLIIRAFIVADQLCPQLTIRVLLLTNSVDSSLLVRLSLTHFVQRSLLVLCHQ